jgi:polyisoprenyl-phosphate glycosyltransferase
VAGLSLVESDLYAIVDVDGEDPPELLKSFLEEVRRGGEVVYGIRSSREEWGVITALRSLFYHINRSIADSPAVLWMGEFSLITRQARDAILQAKTTFPFLRSEMAHIGLTRVGVAYHRGKRMSGRSHYRLWSMTRFAVAGFLSSSTFPLRLILYTAAATGVLFPLVCVILHFSWGQALLLLFLCQFYFLLFAVPMLGLYLARIYKNGIGRPVYVIDQNRTFLT